jgi:excisionase family DNA binding protein
MESPNVHAGRPRKFSCKRRTSVDTGATETQVLFDNLVTVERFAEMLSVGRSTVYELLRDEGLPHFKIGRSTRIPVKEASAWLQKRRRP